MRNPAFIWIIAAFMVLLDIYVYQAIKVVVPVSSARLRIIVIATYWVISVLAVVLIVLMPYTRLENWPVFIRTYFFPIVVGLFFSKIIASLFFMIDDIRRAGTWAVGKVSGKEPITEVRSAAGISRSAFLSWAGLAMGGGLFSTLMYGFNNKYRYQVNRLKLSFQNLPTAFKGLKIVHISDIHSGSFNDKQAVQRGIDKIMKEKPDVILFTGDLVNDRASEMKEYMEVF